MCDMFVLARQDGAGKQSLQRFKLRFEHPSIRKFEKTDAVVVCSGNERSQWTLLPRNDDTIERAARPRSSPEGPHERIPESAVGFETVSERDVIQRRSGSQFGQCVSHALRSAISLKRHAIV